MIGILVAALLDSVSVLAAQGRANVFFPTDERLSWRFTDLVEANSAGRPLAAQARLEGILTILLGPGEEKPTALSSRFAVNPWIRLGAIWKDLSESVRKEAKKRIQRALAKIKDRGKIRRILFNIPEEDLRRKLLPEMAAALLEEGRTAEALRTYQLLEKLSGGEAAPWLIIGMKVASKLAGQGFSPTSTQAVQDPDLIQALERIGKETLSPEASTIVSGPWSFPRTGIKLGSLVARFPLVQKLGSFGHEDFSSVFPVAMGNLLFATNGDAVLAVNAQQGKLLWQKHFRPLHASLRNTVLTVALKDNKLYVARPDGVRSLSVKDGNLLWAVYFDLTEKDELITTRTEPSSEPALAVTPPLARYGRIYVGCLIHEAGSITSVLLCMDADTGGVIWQRHIGTSETRDFLRLGSSPLPLVSAEGRIFFCTNVGLLAACDAEDGTILFVRSYPRLEVMASHYSIRREERWRLTPPRVYQKALFVAPQDSNQLLILDTTTGELLQRIDRSEAEYFLGPFEGSLFLVGFKLRKIKIGKQFDLSLQYEVELPDRPVGRGYVEAAALALPFRDKLIVFDPETGKVVSTYPWESQAGGGSLLPASWGMALAHPGGIDIYRPLSEDIASVESAAESPSLRRLKRACTALRTGDLSSAFNELESYLQNAQKYVSASERRERLRVANLLNAWLKIQLPEEEKLQLIHFLTHEYFSANPQDAVKAFVMKARHYEKIGDLGRALDAYFQALSHAYRAQREGSTPFLILRWDLAVDAVPHLIAKIGWLLSQASDPKGLLAKWEKRARSELDHARAAPNAQAFQEIMYTFPFTEASAEAYLSCAEFYLANQNSQAAKRVLRSYVKTFPHGPKVVQAAVRLVEIVESSGEFEEEKNLLNFLKENYPEKTISFHGKAFTIKDWAQQRLSKITSPESNLALEPPLRFPLSVLWRTRTDLFDRASSLRFLRPKRAIKDYLLVKGDSVVRIFEARTGKLLDLVQAPKYCREGALFSKGESRLLVLAGRREVFIWDIKGKQKPVVLTLAEEGQTEKYLIDCYFQEDRFVCLCGRSLLCFDLEGKKLWEAALPFRGRKPLLVQGEKAFVFSASSPAYACLDASNGKLKKVISLSAVQGRFSVDPLPLPDSTFLLVAGRVVQAVRAEQGKVLWRYTTERMIPRETRFLPQHSDRVYIWGRSMTGCRFLALDRWTGKPVFQGFFSSADPVLEIRAVGNDLVALCGDISRSVLRFTPQGSRVNRQWRRRLYRSFDVGMPFVVSGQTILHGDREANRIVAISARTGTLLEEAVGEVRRFLGGKLLRDYAVEGDTLYVLTESGMAAFRYADPYRPGYRTSSLLLEVMSIPSSVEGGAPSDNSRLFDSAFLLGNLLMNSGRVDTALQMVDRLLWDTYSNSPALFDLWFLLGATQEEAAREEPLIVRCLPAPPDIRVDGYLEEAWPLSTALRLSSPKSILPVQSLQYPVPVWEGPQDLSATFFCAWDQNYFYFALDVRDSVVVPHDPEAERWIGDSLIIDLDPRGDGGLYPGMDDQMLTLYLTVRPRRAKQEESEKPEGKFKARVTDDQSGIVYEVALPWRSLDFDGKERKVEAGAAFGFNVVVTDDDIGSGAKQALSLNASHLLGWKRDRAWEAFRPDFFPKIVLEDASTK